MKKILLIFITLIFTNIAHAETVLRVVDSGSIQGNGSQDMIISSIDTTTGTETTLLTFNAVASRATGLTFMDDYNNKLYIGHSAGRYSVYDINTNTVTATTIGNGGEVFQSGWNGSNVIATGTDAEDGSSTTILGSLDISDSNGNTLIENKADGSVHIGENSLVTIESGGRQQLYATDATGSRIDINIPSGTNLLIDGEDVMGSIDSSIALGAAFASLPTGAEGAGYTCGLGTGFHDSASAISGGCGFDFANYSFVDSMPELFQKASFNIGAASVVHGEGDDATLKAGITFKFGAPKPVREAKDNNLLLENKIDAVMAENDSLKAQIAEINTQLKALNMLAMN